MTTSAIVHEWLTVPGGSEKVALRLLGLREGADLYAAVFEPSAFPELRGHDVRTTVLDRLPGARRHYRALLPLMNLAYEQLDLSGYELVISSSHSAAKNILTGPGTLHICYCHTPMRHAWEPAKTEGELGTLGRLALPLLLSRLRREDLAGAARVDHFIANSRWVAARIAKYYRRNATVVHPPVDVEPFLKQPRKAGDAYLVVSRLVPYKRVDLAVAACTRLARPLMVVGNGRDRERLDAIAGPSVTFLDRLPDARIIELMASCRALLFPGEEDFGMVPVEAQAAGTPIVAYGVGGVLDSVLEERTGVFFPTQSVDSLCHAIERFEAMRFDSDACRKHAEGFRPEHFDREIEDVISRALDDAATVQEQP